MNLLSSNINLEKSFIPEYDPAACTSTIISSISDLNPKKYGIIIKSKRDISKTGLLLPDLENVKTPGEQIVFSCQKASINPQKEPIEIYRFKAKKYKEQSQIYK